MLISVACYHSLEKTVVYNYCNAIIPLKINSIPPVAIGTLITKSISQYYYCNVKGNIRPLQSKSIPPVGKLIT